MKWIVIICLVFVVSCGDDAGSGSGKTLSFISKAANSLPQVATTGSRANISSIPSLANFFKQECYMPSDDGTSYDGFCPADVRTELDAAGTDIAVDGSTVFNKYKLTTSTLIGYIYHAQMYSQGPGFSNDCASFDAANLATANSPAFTGGTDPDQFIIDYYDVLSCVKQNTYDGNSTYATFGYNDNAVYPAVANLTVRYGLPYNDTPDSQTDLFQVYVGMDAITVSSDTPTPTFLAFNFAGAGYSRLILLANLTTHRFVVRSANSTQQILAAGTGGVDETTGTAVTGYYMAKDITAGNTYCVDNSDGTYTTRDTSNCTSTATGKGNIDFWGTMTTAEITAFLDMNSEDATNVAGFLSILAGTDALAASAFPTGTYATDKANSFAETIE